jgi:hypothetical protein
LGQKTQEKVRVPVTVINKCTRAEKEPKMTHINSTTTSTYNDTLVRINDLEESLWAVIRILDKMIANNDDLKQQVANIKDQIKW